MTTLHAPNKRKADDNGSVEDCPLGLLDEQLSNPLVYIGSFLTGKDFSTFLTTAISSRHVKDHALRTHLASVFVAICESMADRCNKFLSNIDAPPSIVAILNDRSTTSKQSIETLHNYLYPNLPQIMKAVFEWSVLLDYCEFIPLRLSKARLAQDGPIQPLWIVGEGKFGSTNSPAILSVPSQNWRPELLFMGEKWMVDCPREDTNLCVSFGEIMPDEYTEPDAAVMSWKDGDYLARMHQLVDFAGGMMAYHDWPFDSEVDTSCSLVWVPKAYKESLLGENARRTFENSESLKWMWKATKFDNNMLTIMAVNHETIPGDHMDGFFERIIKLMIAVEQWL